MSKAVLNICYFYVFLSMAQTVNYFLGIPFLHILWAYVNIFVLFYCLAADALFRKIFKNPAILSFLILIIYHLVNLHFKGTVQQVESLNGKNLLSLWSSVFANFWIILTISYSYIRNEKKTLIILSIAYLIHILCAVYIMKTTGKGIRMKEADIHPNFVAHACGLGMMLLAYMKYKFNISYLWLVLLCIIPVVGIVLSTSRNGLSLIIIFVFTVVVSKMHDNNVVTSNKVITIFVLLIIGIWGLHFLLDNTYVGQRLLQSDNEYYEELHTGTILDFLGERGFYYYYGWLFFLESPITGIGLYNYQLWTGGIAPLHSEIMIHLCEGGIIGMSLYSIFYFYILKNLVRMYIKSKTIENFIVLMFFVCYMIIGITARELYYYYFYPIIGLCVGYIIKNRTFKKLRVVISS